MSEFYVYNAKREKIGLLQNVESVQWLEMYQSPGEVKIVARATPDNLEMLTDGNRIYRAGGDTCALISQVAIDDAETGTTITARGCMTTELLNTRVVMATENIVNVEEGMYALYRRNRRTLPIIVGRSTGYEEKTNTEITWGSVLEAVEKLAQLSGLGIKVVFDPGSGDETFVVYKGIDRTNDDSIDYIGYFGTDMDNVQSASVVSGSSDYKNVAVVVGAGEGADRAVRIVSLGYVTGENRRELYVDARDLQRNYQVATPTGEYDDNGNPIYDYTSATYTDAEYNALLDDRGRKKLAENLRDVSISCAVTQVGIVYGRDYYLGDRVPVKLPEINIYTTARISAATTIWERGGTRTKVTLDDIEVI